MNLIFKAIKVFGLRSTDALISLMCFVTSVVRVSRKLPSSELYLLQELRHKQLVNLIPKEFEGKEVEILDAGCGRGELLKILSSRGHKSLHGFDFHPRDIRWANFRQMDITDLDENTYDRKFDVIFLSEVLEHLENPAAALRSLSKYLKSDGVIVMSIPNSMSIWEKCHYLFTCNFRRYKKEKPNEYGHISIFSEATLASISRRSNLEISKPLGGVMFLNGYLFLGGKTVSNNWSYHSAYLLKQV